MSARMIVVTPPLIREVLGAVSRIRRPNNVYVSRAGIESELKDHPDQYPLLSPVSQAFRRQVITKVMKQQFSFWGESTAKKRSAFVWDVSCPVVMSHV